MRLPLLAVSTLGVGLLVTAVAPSAAAQRVTDPRADAWEYRIERVADPARPVVPIGWEAIGVLPLEAPEMVPPAGAGPVPLRAVTRFYLLSRRPAAPGPTSDTGRHGLVSGNGPAAASAGRTRPAVPVNQIIPRPTPSAAADTLPTRVFPLSGPHA